MKRKNKNPRHKGGEKTHAKEKLDNQRRGSSAMKPAEMQNSLAADCTAIDKNRGKFNCFNRTAQFAHARSQTVTMPVQGISRPIIARTSPSTPQVTPHRVASDRARQAGKGRGL